MHGTLANRATPRASIDRPATQSAACSRLLVAFGLLILSMRPVSAAPPLAADDSIRGLRSRHFVLSTDLPSDEARCFLNRMEHVLKKVERYWSRPLPGSVHCYLVEDLARWPEGEFPAANARHLLRQVRGGTDLTSNKDGDRQVTIYAMAEPGVVEHEVVHAYCFQTFGRGGPVWYREGMAELFSQEVTATTPGPCRRETIKLLGEAEPVDVRELTSSRQISPTLADVMAASPGLENDLSSRQPSPSQGVQLTKARVAYAQSWALCYLLHHNRSYHDRFQAFGKHLMSGAGVTLQQAFPGRLSEIDFEFNQFVQHIDHGYRLDICSWDWTRQPKHLEVGQSITVRLRACRGFQPANVRLSENQEYSIDARGAWYLEEVGPPIDADGNDQGYGSLEAVVFDEFQLSDPIQLGKNTTLSADQAGSLYLRCRDNWDRVGDNRGQIVVRLTRVR